MSRDPREFDRRNPGEHEQLDPPGRAAPVEGEAGLHESAKAAIEPRRVRWMAAFVVAVCAAVLLTAALLRPDPRGFGTHEQLGMARCGWLVRSRLPCPTCGMTTAFSHAVRGSVVSAWTSQPAGLLMALGMMAALPLALWSLVSGRPPVRVLSVVTPLRLFFLIAGLFLGGWGYKLLAGLASGAFPADGWQ
ncbi:MAG: DUF2752 domain-containing protein [Phycisphaerales bacterium]|nr:DUF2752 domain-containing protein [Phycisphaerales bacterium]